MDANKPIAGLSVLVAGALVLGGAGSAGAGVWYLQQRATNAAREQAEDARSRLAELESRSSRLEAELASATAALADKDPAGGRASTDPTSALSPISQDEEQGVSSEDGKHLAFVVEVARSAGDTSLVLDFADLLTGDAAREAHEADGLGEIDGESFYIRNRNAKTRTLRLAGDAEIVVWSWDSETEDVAAKEITLARFLEAMPGGSHADQRLQAMPYWFTVSNGTIVRVEEQFLP